jgi:essential nuclear protein 1
VSGSKRKQQDDEENVDDGNRHIDSRTSRKILKIGRDLAEEDEVEEGDRNPPNRPPSAAGAFTLESRFGAEEGQDHDRSGSEDEEAWGDEEDIDEEVASLPLRTTLRLRGSLLTLQMNRRTLTQPIWILLIS